MSRQIATFTTGLEVFYPSLGIGTITALTKRTINGETISTITIVFPRTRVTAHIPTLKAVENGLQPVTTIATDNTVAAALGVLRGKKSAGKGTNVRIKHQNLQNDLNQARTLVQVAEVVRDITPDKGTIIAYTNELLQKQAVNLLIEIICSGTNATPEAVVTRLRSIFREAGKEPPRFDTW